MPARVDPASEAVILAGAGRAILLQLASPRSATESPGTAASPRTRWRDSTAP
ncbi:hypothetical protein [Frondihabitans sucicola]|uniref:hypothetical protein n=1 Tax=Frondihabitans sucicola TaxID=1268041 RepID=UPI002572A4D3|nr:hypothetical protein [Frondihabitans sucicola]